MSELTGTGALLRLALRRDRVLVPAWTALFVVTAVSSASATVDLYPSAASRAAAASAINEVPALVALYGRIWDPTSLGALSLLKTNGVFTIGLALLAIVLVVRHTRAEEENGRLELLGATVLGRRAALTAALLVSVGTMLAIGVLSAIGLTAVGLPASGSWAFGLAWALTGAVFAGVAAVTAQLTITSRAATGGAVVVVGVTYVLRGFGDVAGTTESPGLLTWLSPFGWGQQVRPYAGDRWWVLLVLVGGVAILVATAYELASRRDLGAGLLADRPGPAVAAPSLRTPLALAWRQHRFALLGWTVGYALMGFAFGTISADLGDILDSEQARDMIARLGGTSVLTDAFVAAELAIIAFVTAAYAVTTAMRLHTEEVGGRAEPVLACAVPRTRWLASHTVIALGGATWLTLVLGIAVGTGNAIALHDTGRVGVVLGGALVQLPAIWAMAGLTVLLFGVAPRLVVLAWVALVGFVLVQEVGALLGLPSWVSDLSPFAHLPMMPGGAMTWTPVVVLTLVAAALLGIGTAGFRRRDLDTP